MKNAKSIDAKQIEIYSAEYSKNTHFRAMANALAKNSISNIAYSHDSLAGSHYKFSLDIETMPVTNQEASGRCWIFAGLNVLREVIAKKYNLEKFELSQNYVAFWDKYEKANYFYESIIDLIDRPIDDRHLSWVLSTGIQDGGQWDMLVNVIKKYGLIPKDAMEETYQSSHTGDMNRLINRKLRKDAAYLRRMHDEGAGVDKLQAEKEVMLKEMYAFMRMNFGTPPEKFDFEYVDKDKKYAVVRGLDPIRFFKEYVGDTLDDYISIINAPTKDKPFGEPYTVEYIGNVVGGNEILYLNLTMDELISLTLKQLKAGEVVWFGSDVGAFGDRESGIWDNAAYEYDTAFSMDFTLSKEDMLDYRQSAMNHAMVITGVNLDDAGKPIRWKIQNSWGDKRGKDGYFLMSNTWFNQFVYQAVINRKYLDAANIEALKKTPKRLNPWDPMGTLAK